MEREMRSIMNEQDLEYYESHLSSLDNSCNINRKSLFGAHLTSCKGKLVKVEICSGGCRQTKSGLLLDVGEDFISIRVGNAPVSTAIPIANIHSITFIHGNNCKMMR